jgi:hypothetical protein
MDRSSTEKQAENWFTLCTSKTCCPEFRFLDDGTLKLRERGVVVAVLTPKQLDYLIALRPRKEGSKNA